DLALARTEVAAGVPLIPETIGLERDCGTQGLIAVQVLDLALWRPDRPAVIREANRDVDVDSPCTLLEPHVRDSREDEHLPQRSHVLLALLCGCDIWPGDDLEERNPGAVEVDAAGAWS